ncbi:hypothetical protein BCR36DRAFT_183322 [Piromyces finnis]|uniref:L domain-like protein n=1 Tax=Piromyces finnis TaxID=1754191 RepID=A0A1Y1VFT7_9FUNG|nr:hypothetical protein BCR36DRAFT_183322 [Piromyces finnis]|eukprot:ORX55284.1 hypothetical protein BCR36DRAFT_183322 [Piromyces finnis]
MNILKFYVVFLNILLVLCSAEENDIEKLHNFLSNYIKGALYDVFVSHYNCNDKIYMNCQDNNITSLNIRLNNDENLNFNNFNDFPSFHSLKTIKIFNINFNNQEFPSRLLNSQNYPELTQLYIQMN